MIDDNNRGTNCTMYIYDNDKGIQCAILTKCIYMNKLNVKWKYSENQLNSDLQNVSDDNDHKPNVPCTKCLYWMLDDNG